MDEWPKASSDDVGEWLQPPTPSGRAEASRPGEGLKVDLSSLRSQVKKDQIAFFDKECSKVADHIYLGGDSVARNREILRQNGITHVLNCVGFVCAEYFKAHLVYKTLWLQDSPTEDITSILYDVFDYFEDVREQGGRVLVHCCQGVSRSTSLVIAYLMWREGQSFDDAFQFVKAARGIANPNMGFACQLLQCQKRVHAIPLSPNSGLRMYRMAPHSPYDALHLVPKMLNDPSPAALDSRGAFILHVVCTIFVWIGKNCDQVIEKDAKAAAFQVVRYEKVPGPIITVEEGEEPADFWDAFSNTRPGLDDATKVEKEEVESGRRPVVGRRRVEAYDVDFDLFYQAITGGVVPPFPSSGPGHETHLPARESNWSILRRKFLSRTMCRVFSDSALIREVDPCVNRVQISNIESSTSPPYLSPNSFSSDSSSSSKSTSESPTISPSTSSSPLLTPSPASSSLPKPVILPSKSSQPSHDPEQLRTNLQATLSPSKGFSRSIAERRGSFSLLKLPALNKDASISSRKVIGAAPTYLESTQKIFERQDCNLTSVGDDAGTKDMEVEPSVLKTFGEFDVRGLKGHADIEDRLLGDDPLRSSSIGLLDIFRESGNSIQALIFRWPSFEKLTTFSRENLNPQEVLIFLPPTTSKDGMPFRMVYLWIGSSFKQVDRENQFENGKDIGEVNQINWNQVGRNFLAFIGLPIGLPIKVFEEQDPEKFLEMLNPT